jgi:sporulation protein YlmC with PRC-barrel domain
MANAQTREKLYEFFKTGAKPSEQNFRDLIDSALNIHDDGIEKPLGTDAPLKITARGEKENLLDFYVSDTPIWRLNQKPTGANPGFNVETGGNSKLFIESATGNVGLSTTKPTAKLHIEQGELKIIASQDTNTTNIGSFLGKSGTKGIGIGSDRIQAIGSDANQDINIIPKGNGKLSISSAVQISNTVQITQTDGKKALSIGTDKIEAIGTDTNQDINLTPKGTGKLVVSASVQITNKDGNKGIGVRGDRIEAIGNDTNQDITVTPKGSGKLSINGNLQTTGSIIPSTGSEESNGIIFPKDAWGGSGDVAWIRYFRRDTTGEACTLEIGIANDVNDHLVLMPSGNVGIGTATPDAKLEVSGNLKVTGEIQGKVKYSNEYTWKAGESAKKMGHSSKCVAFLTYVQGKFAGGGEKGSIYIGDDGYWYLSGAQGGDGKDIMVKARCIGESFT